MSDTEFLQRQTSKDVDVDLENIDELLAQLTAEELDELNGDFDPDVSLVVFLFSSLFFQYLTALEYSSSGEYTVYLLLSYKLPSLVRYLT